MFHLFLVLMFSIYQGRGSAAPSVIKDEKKWTEEDRGTLFYMRYYASYSYVNPMNLAFFLSCVLWVFSISFILWSSPQGSAVRGAAGMDGDADRTWGYMKLPKVCFLCVLCLLPVCFLWVVWCVSMAPMFWSPPGKRMETWARHRRLMSLGIVDCDCIHTHSWIVLTHTARPSRLVPLDSCPHTSSHSLDRHRHTYSHTWALCGSSGAAVWYMHCLMCQVSRWKRACLRMSFWWVFWVFWFLCFLCFLCFSGFLCFLCLCVFVWHKETRFKFKQIPL